MAKPRWMLGMLTARPGHFQFPTDSVAPGSRHKLRRVPSAASTSSHFRDLNVQYKSGLIWKDPVLTTSLEMNNGETSGGKTPS